MEVKIDLKNTSDKDRVIEILGEALGYDSNTFWGRNWDAFNNILRYMDTGGIWGTNKKLAFPIVLVISSSQTFKDQAPHQFAILEDILKDTKMKYIQEKKEFEFRFE